MSKNLSIDAGPKTPELCSRGDRESNLSDAEVAAHADKINAATQARHGVADRVCGDCTACCTVMGVAELNKATYQPCPHNCGSCAIYDSRPRTCRSYCCDWLLGLVEGDERRRPDQLGLLFNHDKMAGKPVTVAYQVWPDAARQSNNESVLQEMSQEMPIILLEYQSSKCDVITPDEGLRQYIRRLLHDDWCQNLYFQVSVTNVHPAK